MMSELLFPFPDRDASRKILETDPCFGKIPLDERKAVFERAWNTGEREAKRFWKQGKEGSALSMLQILTERQFHIKVLDADYVMGNIRYFCEYMSEQNIVYIYRKSVELWAEANRLPYETALNVILAHEYFHYLEWHEIGCVSRQCLVPMVTLGPFSLGKTGVAALSEVGANAFANSCYKKWKQYLKEHKEEERMDAVHV